MDIKGKIEEIVSKVQKDPQLGAEFQKDPVSVVEKLLGVDLPNDQLNQLVEGIKAKINLDQLGSMLGGLFGKR